MTPRAPAGSDDPSSPFVPYVRSTEQMAELTPLAIGLGVVLSVTFGMVNDGWEALDSEVPMAQ